MDATIDEALIKKETLHPGVKYIPLKSGTRVKFHFQTRKCDANKTLIDDSRNMGLGKPMELVLGKQFKLEVWEVIVQKMAIYEVAKFTVDKSLVPQYPFVSKTIRDAKKPTEERKHCCGMTIQNEGLGYKDLDDLFKEPCDLEFIIELLMIELPDQYEKESWQLADDEKLTTITDLKEKGNNFYKDKKYDEATINYGRALAMLEQLMLKEKPNDEEWLELFDQKKPLLLNYAQCKLFQQDYYPVIEYCTEVLNHDRTNVKALFRRAKAHVGAWNPQEAIKDFKRCAELDSSLSLTVEKELNLIEEQIKKHNLEDKKRYEKLFQ